jgi:AbrB family looped-hinge helix DNA binding protein
MAVKVTSKGRVTIPKRVHDHLGIRPGDAVEFQIVGDGRVVLFKAGDKPGQNRFEALRGRAGPGLSTDEIMALTRGE